MSLSEELKKALYKQYFRRPSRLDTNLISLMIDELIYLEKDFYFPVHKIKYILPNSNMPTRIIKIASPKRNHSSVALSAIAAVAISVIILTLSHNSQADTYHEFFWWIDKNSSGSSLLTSPAHSSYADKNIQLNSYDLSYSSDGIFIIIGMAENYNVSTEYRFYYKWTYDSIDINVYHSSDLLFLWEYNGHDYYLIADKYNDTLRKVIIDYIDYIRNVE